MKHFCFLLLVCICLFAFKAPSGDENRSVAFIDKHTGYALQIQKKYGIPASICLAQCMVESGLGSSILAHNANNYFGIKCHSDWNGATFLKKDDEKTESCFRSYKSVEESFEDYGKRLSTYFKYEKLKGIPISDYTAWAREIKAAGYASNKNYDQLLIAKIKEFDLTKYDRLDWPDHYEPLSTQEHTNNSGKTRLSDGPSIDLYELSEIEKALGIGTSPSSLLFLPTPVERKQEITVDETPKPFVTDETDTPGDALKVYVSPPALHPLQINTSSFRMPVIDIR